LGAETNRIQSTNQPTNQPSKSKTPQQQQAVSIHRQAPSHVTLNSSHENNQAGTPQAVPLHPSLSKIMQSKSVAGTTYYALGCGFATRSQDRRSEYGGMRAAVEGNIWWCHQWRRPNAASTASTLSMYSVCIFQLQQQIPAQAAA
jgi:hypothetical protein